MSTITITEYTDPDCPFAWSAELGRRRVDRLHDDRWADEPLATAEVAAVCAIDRQAARQQLGRVATEHHVGFDGLWSM